MPNDWQGCATCTPCARRPHQPQPAPPPTGFPYWDAPLPDPKRPLGGYSKLQQLSKAEVLHGGKEPLPGSDAGPIGSYNHNVMFDYLAGDGFFLMWKT